jgi:hypothetical protein
MGGREEVVKDSHGQGWAAGHAAAEEVAEMLVSQVRELKEAWASTQDALAAKTRELDAQCEAMTRLGRLEAEARAGERQVWRAGAARRMRAYVNACVSEYMHTRTRTCTRANSKTRINMCVCVTKTHTCVRMYTYSLGHA